MLLFFTRHRGSRQNEADVQDIDRKRKVAIDLRKDCKTICKHVAERVKEYPLYENWGPGDDDDPISMITLGFDFDQSCWVSLVFDTRPDAAPDGEWNDFIDDLAIDFEHWFDRPGKVTLVDGTAAKIEADFDAEPVAQYFGDCLKEVMVQSRELFASLPMTEDCILLIEHNDGAYGETVPLDASKKMETETDRNPVSHLPTKKQIAYWLDKLKKIEESEWASVERFYCTEALEEIGAPAVVPMLKKCREWAVLPEYTTKRGKKRTSLALATIKLLSCLGRIGHATPEVERLLLGVFRDAMEVKVKQKRWGKTPFWAATCLEELCGYPIVVLNQKNYVTVENADAYLRP